METTLTTSLPGTPRIARWELSKDQILTVVYSTGTLSVLCGLWVLLLLLKQCRVLYEESRRQQKAKCWGFPTFMIKLMNSHTISGHLWSKVLRGKHPDRPQSHTSHEFLLLWTGLKSNWLLLSHNVQQDAICLLGGSEGPKGVYEGNVYVGFGGSSAKPVCDDSWDATDGQVVCRQLGFFGLVTTFRNYVSTWKLNYNSLCWRNVKVWGNKLNLNLKST